LRTSLPQHVEKVEDPLQVLPVTTSTALALLVGCTLPSGDPSPEAPPASSSLPSTAAPSATPVQSPRSSTESCREYTDTDDYYVVYRAAEPTAVNGADEVLLRWSNGSTSTAATTSRRTPGTPWWPAPAGWSPP
jgi:hypothetical protein